MTPCSLSRPYFLCPVCERIQSSFACYLRGQRAGGNVVGCLVFPHVYRVQKRCSGLCPKCWNEEEEFIAPELAACGMSSTYTERRTVFSRTNCHFGAEGHQGRGTEAPGASGPRSAPTRVTLVGTSSQGTKGWRLCNKQAAAETAHGPQQPPGLESRGFQGRERRGRCLDPTASFTFGETGAGEGM